MFLQQAIVAVEVAPEARQSEEILHWILKQPGKSTPQSESAAQLLISHHTNSARSLRALLTFAQRPAKWTPAIFEAFSKANKTSKDFWIVEATNALHAKSLLEIADDIQAANNRHEYEPRLGNELVSRLAKADLDELESSLVQSLSSISKKYGRKRMGGLTVREFADGMLFSVKHLRLGKEVYDLKGESPDGNEISLSHHEGKVVMLDFWATWCAPCIGVLPELKESTSQYDPVRFVLIGVSADRDVKQLQSAMTRHEITWPIIHDKNSTLQTKWQALSLPYYYVLDANHVVCYRGNDHRLALNTAQRLLRE
ncbi:MAG: TlpA family protein disulfide reductase [Planctomycetales bacterium]|nr:TlpA family protein disulfide reductase [Planctomycetales bacterium]